MSAKLNLAIKGAIALGLAGFATVSMATPIVYQGIDVGASSFAAATNSLAAATAFNTASGGSLSIYDFDTHTTGLSLSPASSPQSCGFALCGGNTTAGGSGFYGAVYSTTITFDSPVDAFGAYFSGWQRSDQVLTFNDGSSQTLSMPAGDLTSGGMIFFGFIDAGKSISSVTYSTALGDYVAVDDIRFGNTGETPGVPEPGSLALLGIGLAGFAASRRKR